MTERLSDEQVATIERLTVLGRMNLDRPHSHWTDYQRFWECLVCGAVVVDPERHQEWHDSQDGGK